MCLYRSSSSLSPTLFIKCFKNSLCWNKVLYINKNKIYKKYKKTTNNNNIKLIKHLNKSTVSCWVESGRIKVGLKASWSKVDSEVVVCRVVGGGWSIVWENLSPADPLTCATRWERWDGASAQEPFKDLKTNVENKSKVHRQPLERGQNGNSALPFSCTPCRRRAAADVWGRTGWKYRRSGFHAASEQNVCTGWTLWPCSALIKAIWDGKERLRWGKRWFMGCNTNRWWSSPLLLLPIDRCKNLTVQRQWRTCTGLFFCSRFCVSVLLVLILELQLQCSSWLFSLWCNVLSKTIWLQMAY